MRAVPSRSPHGSSSSHAVLAGALATVLGSLALLMGWTVVASGGASTSAAASTTAEAGAVSRLAAGAGWMVTATGSGATALGANTRVRPLPTLTELVGVDHDDPAVNVPWWAVAVTAFALVAPRCRRAAAAATTDPFRRTSEARRSGRGPPSGIAPTYV